MRVVAILQARINSSRLPGKMLLPLLDKPLVQHVIERVMRATKLDEVVLAYPDKDHDSFFPIVRQMNDRRLGYTNYHGDENDVVGRYVHAAEYYGADIIVRIPCDNPCVDPWYIDKAVISYLDNCLTFYSNTTVDIPQPEKFRILYVDGIGCEVFSFSRLKWLARITQGSSELREHPHKWFYDKLAKWESDGDCGIEITLTLPSSLSQLRLDVNTQADYEFIKDIYDHFGHNRFTTAEVVAYLERKKVTA